MKTNMKLLIGFCVAALFVITVNTGLFDSTRPDRCSAYVMTQAIMPEEDRKTDATVRWYMKKMNTKAYDTGWEKVYYGTPICHGVYTDYKRAETFDFYFYYNPAKQTWEHDFGCTKSNGRYYCDNNKL